MISEGTANATMIMTSQLIVTSSSSNALKHQWWSTECIEKEDDSVFASMKKYFNRSSMHSLKSILSPAQLTNQRDTFLTISRFSAGVRSSYQRSRLSRNAHSFKKLAAFSFCDRRKLYDNVHVIRMLSLSSDKVKRCCFFINLANAWSYSSIYSDKVVSVFCIYESTWLIIKERSSSRSTSFDKPNEPQMSDRSRKSMLQWYSSFIDHSRLFSRILDSCSLLIDFNFRFVPSWDRLICQEVIKIDSWSAVGKYSFTSKTFESLDESENSRFTLSKISSHWSFNDCDNHLSTSSTTSPTWALLLCE